MKKKLKDELREIYNAPPPKRKRTFLRQMAPKPMDAGYILRSQVSYISKQEWILSATLFGVAVLMSCFFETIVFGIVLAMMPFLAVAGVSESMRSVIYGMDELEMTARFSLKGIILARMCIIGIENMAIVLISALFMQGELLITMMYLAVPYLLTVSGSLVIVQNISGKESIYICMGYSAAVSLAVSFGFLNYTWIYQERFAGLWMAAVLLLLYIDYKEGRRLLSNLTGGEIWN